MHTLNKITLVGVILSITALLLVSGCCCLKPGSLMHPQIRTVAIGEFMNDTDEAALTSVLRQKLTEAFTTDGALILTTPSKADVIVQGRILSYTPAALASSKVSDADREQAKRDNYQTQIYQISVVIGFELKMPGRPCPIMDMREVRGTAPFNRLPDLTVARDEGLRRAIQDAAQQITVAVTEGW